MKKYFVNPGKTGQIQSTIGVPSGYPSLTTYLRTDIFITIDLKYYCIKLLYEQKNKIENI